LFVKISWRASEQKLKHAMNGKVSIDENCSTLQAYLVVSLLVSTQPGMLQLVDL